MVHKCFIVLIKSNKCVKKIISVEDATVLSSSKTTLKSYLYGNNRTI